MFPSPLTGPVSWEAFAFLSSCIFIVSNTGGLNRNLDLRGKNNAKVNYLSARLRDGG